MNIQCELCGTDAYLISALVEGTTLWVCEKCSAFGKVVVRKEVSKKIERISVPSVQYRIIEGFDALLKNGRERRGLKQEEVAIVLNEKLSLLQKIESGHSKPSFPLAKKLEQFFHIVLVEEEKAETVEKPLSKNESLTIGDFVKRS